MTSIMLLRLWVDFQEDLNGIFTYEGWFNILKPTAGTTLFHVLTPQQSGQTVTEERYTFTQEKCLIVIPTEGLYLAEYLTKNRLVVGSC